MFKDVTRVDVLAYTPLTTVTQSRDERFVTHHQ